MLVLSRKKHEEFVVIDPQGNECATVLMVDIRGDRVRLGIDAEQEYRVYRREVWAAIKQTKSDPVVRDPLGVAEAYEQAAAEGASANV